MSKVAETILDQLGRNKFIAMTGARYFTSTETSLSFQLPKKANKKIFAVRIVLNPNDLYTIQFYKTSPAGPELVSSYSDVYSNQLCALFESETGLLTRL